MPKTNNISTILEEFDKEFGSMFYLDLPDKNNPAVIAGTRKANTIKSFLRTSLTSLLEEMEVEKKGRKGYRTAQETGYNQAIDQYNEIKKGLLE